MWHIWWRGEAYVGFCWGTLDERVHFGDLVIEGKIVIRWIFKKWDVGVWTASV
jgi:hypothetical protein